MLEVASQAPSFSLYDQDGNIHHLEDYKGKKVLLYFYPKASTPGCTKQACGYSERLPEYHDKNVEVLAVSKDSIKAIKNFQTKQNLTITLLSDESLETIQAYDVWKEKKNYGKVYMGVVRTTYLIDEKGVIIYASDKVKAASDFDTMLKEI